MIKEILYKIFKIEEPPCQSCENLKMQLAIVNNEKSQMLQSILSMSKSEIPSPAPVVMQPVKQSIPWAVRKQMLEAEDRKTAQALAAQEKRDKEIAELEKELGVEEKKEDAQAV